MFSRKKGHIFQNFSEETNVFENLRGNKCFQKNFCFKKETKFKKRINVSEFKRVHMFRKFFLKNKCI